MSKDIGNYLNDGTFRIRVHHGVYWVPLNTLGKTRYTNDEMRSISRLSAREKRLSIANLYEAVQLFQLSGFKGMFDNQHYDIDGHRWEVHKPPEEAVFSNEGCCATDTNWLAYMLNSRYDHIGAFCYGNADMNGHITTYIRHNGLYYFIDMMMCREDSQSTFCAEGASLAEWENEEWAGFLYESHNLVDYCLFTKERMKAKNRDVPYFFYTRDHVTATGAEQDTAGKTVFYAPACDNPNLVLLDEKEGHRFEVRELPSALPVYRG